MKNALFSGISNKKQDDSSDDEPAKLEAVQQASQPIDLLDFDGSAPANITQTSANDNNLLDLMGDTQPSQSTQSNLMDDVYGMNTSGSTQPPALAYQGVEGMTTASFG